MSTRPLPTRCVGVSRQVQLLLQPPYQPLSDTVDPNLNRDAAADAGRRRVGLRMTLRDRSPTVGGDDDAHNGDNGGADGGSLMTAMTQPRQLLPSAAMPLGFLLLSVAIHAPRPRSCPATLVALHAGVTGLEPRRRSRYCFHYRPVSLTV